MKGYIVCYICVMVKKLGFIYDSMVFVYSLTYSTLVIGLNSKHRVFPQHGGKQATAAENGGSEYEHTSQ